MSGKVTTDVRLMKRKNGYQTVMVRSQAHDVLNCSTTLPTLDLASVRKSHDQCEITETQEWISHCNGSFSSICSMQNKMSIKSILWTSIS